MRFNTNHDKNAYDGPPVKIFSPEGARATAVLMFTYPGVPMIYNGEEVGNEKKLSLFEKEDIDWSKGEDFRRLYETLGMLHRKHPALRRGSFLPVQNSDSTKVYSFMRTMREDTVLVVISFNTFPKKVNLILPTHSSIFWKDFFPKQSLQLKTNRLEITMPRLGFAVLYPMSEVK
jgi:glycosidase